MPYLLPLPWLDAFWRDDLYWLATTPGAGSGATDDALLEWEQRSGLRLPAELRTIYLQRNGGVSDWLDTAIGVEGPLTLHANFGNHWSGLTAESSLRGTTLGEVSDGIDFGDDDADYRHALGGDADHLWVVANYGSSHYLLLDYRTSDTPAVTLFDDDSRFAGDGTIRGTGLYVIARTFTAFLDACRREIDHPLAVWAARGTAVDLVATSVAQSLSAVERAPARMELTEGWRRQYGVEHLRLPDPYLAERFQPDFGPVRQFTGGVLGEATLRVYRNHSEQRTRAERFAAEDDVLVSLALPVSAPAALPAEARSSIESALDTTATSWRCWLDTDGADFVADDDMRTPYIDHSGSGSSSLSSAAADAV